MADPSPGRGGVEWLVDQFKRLSGRLDSLEGPSGTQIFNAVPKLQEQVATLQAMVATLQAMQRREYAEWVSWVTGSTGWYPSPCSVLITSSTGRIEVGYGGSLNGGNGYFCYSVVRVSDGSVIVDRNVIQGSPAQRVAVTGGSSFTPSGWRTAPVDVPVDVQVRVALEIYGGSTATNFAGGAVSARVVA